MSNDRQKKRQASEPEPCTSSGQRGDRRNTRRYRIYKLKGEGPPKLMQNPKLLPLYNPPVIFVDPNIIEIPDDDKRVTFTDPNIIEISDDDSESYRCNSPQLLSERVGCQWLYAKKYVKKPRRENTDGGGQRAQRLLNVQKDHNYSKPYRP